MARTAPISAMPLPAIGFTIPSLGDVRVVDPRSVSDGDDGVQGLSVASRSVSRRGPSYGFAPSGGGGWESAPGSGNGFGRGCGRFSRSGADGSGAGGASSLNTSSSGSPA